MWRRMKATSGLAALLVLGTAACVDLAVENPNAPDASRALSSAGDVEALIAGGYNRWIYVTAYSGPSMMLSVASGQHSAPWGNSGMEYYARIPRQPTINSPGDANVGNLINAFYESYRVLSAMHDGLQQMDSGKVDLGTHEVRARAYAKYMQGLALGSVALLYDSAYIYDETMGPKDAKLTDYKTAMTAALGYFDDAIALATGASFTLPETWMSQEVDAATLVQLAYSYKARFRASVARTPTDRGNVDWAAVKSDAQNGVTADWDLVYDCDLPKFCATGYDAAVEYMNYSGWQMQNNWVAGMADTSGHYQAWIATATIDKRPFMIFTPDTRWPQGGDATQSDSLNQATQLANPGAFYAMNTGDSRIWSRPDRGTWRWSYYEQQIEPFYTAANVYAAGSIPEVKPEEMKALIAEADYRAGNWAAVETFVNATRTTHGLNATNSGTSAGQNTSCVPKLPNGTCGDLWEMFKWEKRLETQFAGPLRIGWYFDGRGWGDLMEGTIIQFPTPYKEMQILQQAVYNYGGVGGQYGAPVGTYGY